MRRTQLFVASALSFAFASVAACTPAPPADQAAPANDRAAARAMAAPTPDGTSWSVYITTKLGNGTSYVCSGTLIARDAVLTAAHCLERADGSVSPASAVRTLVGAGDPQGRPAVWRDVSWVGLHPSRAYRYVDGLVAESVYDVAVLRLDRPVESSPLPLAIDAASVQPGPMTTYGYGGLAAHTPVNPDGSRADVVSISPTGKLGIGGCGERDVSADHLCMASADPAIWGTVPGDSGGPWVRTVKGGEVQVAVTSYGTVDVPGDSVGTNVLDALDWVRSAAGLLHVPAGTVLRDAASGTAWQVGRDGYRRRFPDALLGCLAAPAVDLDRFTIEQVPEAVGETLGGPASCPVASTTTAPAPATVAANRAPSAIATPTTVAAATPTTDSLPAPATTAPVVAAATDAASTPAVAASADAVASRRPVATPAIRIYEGPTSPRAGWLAITGSDPRVLIVAALALVGLGIAAVAVQLRLRRTNLPPQPRRGRLPSR